MSTNQVQPVFRTGQAVNFMSFTNHKGDLVEGADGLTVVDVELVECSSISNWYRIKAVRGDGRNYFSAAERFFEPSTAAPVDLAVLLALASDHRLPLGRHEAEGGPRS